MLSSGAGQGSRRALVFGGTGAVGSAVLRALASRGVETLFTYHRQGERAAALARDLGQRAEALDLAKKASIEAFFAKLHAEDRAPDLFFHCAAVLGAEPEDWDATVAVNARSAFLACRALAAPMAARGGGDIVLVGALDRGQSLPLPPAFAASQGALGALAMAMAKELGPRGIRVNLAVSGLLDAGLSRGLSPRLREDYLALSALRRLGRPDEVARVLVWLGLDNHYLSGKIVPINGGI
ncbi:MAG: SDR family oxidoreductase [Minicystis sp.]